MWKYRRKTYVRGWQKLERVFCFLISDIADSSTHQLKNLTFLNHHNSNKIKQNSNFPISKPFIVSYIVKSLIFSHKSTNPILKLTIKHPQNLLTKSQFLLIYKHFSRYIFYLISHTIYPAN